jgi:DNA-binding GntR family transcriptional regulator
VSDGDSSAHAPARRAGAEIYERLKQDILTFEFRPGERLVELELCDRYEVSRTPVREALRRLEDDGLVVARDKGGRIVKGLDISDYEDVYAVRAPASSPTLMRCSTAGWRGTLPKRRRSTAPT